MGRKEYRIGTSGWRHRHWDGKFYRKAEEGGWLEFYGKQLGTVEVPDTFYDLPGKEEMRQWKRAVPRGFEFTLRAPLDITHRKRFSNVDEELKEFYDTGKFLRGKMGLYLFQAPHDFVATKNAVERMGDFLKTLDRRRDNAVEFTHESWWRGDVVELFKKRRIPFCTVKGLGLPRHVVATSNTLVVRFHGPRYGGKYDKRRVKTFAKELKGADCEKVYAYFSNDSQAAAPLNALQLLEALGKGKK